MSCPSVCDLLALCPQPTTQLFIDGKFVKSKADKWINNYNPVSRPHT